MPLQEAWSPAEVALKLADAPGLCWLDGGLSHGHEGRFSFLAAHPSRVQKAYLSDPEPLAALAALDGFDGEQRGAGPLGPEDVPRWIGHIAYDAHPVAHARVRHTREALVPCLSFARYDVLYAYDHAHGAAYLAGDDEALCAEFAARLRRAAGGSELAFEVAQIEATDRAAHMAAISRALTHIRDGDVYQINLARRWRGRFSGSALALFLRMRAQSPVPLGYFAQDGDQAVLGRSMERFLRYRKRDGALWTSPIKGTIARAGDDASEAQRLRSDDKEHAEHAMVIDLMRNDLSRVSESGSVEVRDAFTVLPFAGLSHLISTVAARAKPELDLPTLLARTFPPGSVTGTPKERALMLIEELEPFARGVYTGALGFVDRTGGISLAVAIRTASVSADQVSYCAGGGIVWGSDPARECAETELKAQVFLNALR
jgi:anthranilate/para-aminobenzoate synthase component I